MTDTTPTTWVCYDTQDTSWYREFSSGQAARACCAEKNRENSRYGDRYSVTTLSELQRLAIVDDEETGRSA